MTADPENSNQSLAAGDRAALNRILDASCNRCSEGWRVVEDLLRFGWGDRLLAESARRGRHRLASLAAGRGLPLARRAGSDVGRGWHSPEERPRKTIDDALAANLKRIQQAARSIEECLRILDPSAAGEAEAVRFAAYELETACAALHLGQTRLAGAQLCVLLDGRGSRAAFDRMLDALLEGGVDLIQLRDKSLDDRALLQLGSRLSQRLAASGRLWIMNDRPDLARLCGAAGVHCGQEDLPVDAARQIVGVDRLVGVSTHDARQADDAIAAGANYLGVGPIFPSQTKSDRPVAGLAWAIEVVQRTSLPCFAIGGIDRHNLPQLLQAGLRRVAVHHAIVNDSDPAAAVAEFRRLMDEAPPADVAPGGQGT